MLLLYVIFCTGYRNIKKSDRHIRKGTITEKVVFIRELANEYTIKMLCKVLKIPRSTYYEALVYEPSNKEIEFYAFGQQVALAYAESKGRYGAPKIHQVLLKAGIACSIKRVQRHMKRLELRSITVKKYRPQKEQ